MTLLESPFQGGAEDLGSKGAAGVRSLTCRSVGAPFDGSITCF